MCLHHLLNDIYTIILLRQVYNKTPCNANMENPQTEKKGDGLNVRLLF